MAKLKCPYCSIQKSNEGPAFLIETIKHQYSVEYRVTCSNCGSRIYSPRLEKKFLNLIYKSARPCMNKEIQYEIFRKLKQRGKKVDKIRFFSMYLERDPSFAEYLECEYDYLPVPEGSRDEQNEHLPEENA